MYQPALSPADPDSFEAVNGWLDADNVDTTEFSEKLSREMTQRGSLVQAGGVGGTSNLDYFHDWFVGVDMVDVEDLQPSTSRGDYASWPGRYLATPGLGINFYIPWATADVIFRWNICWTGDSDLPRVKHSYRAFIDGAAIISQRRDVQQVIDTGPSPAQYHGNFKGRLWSGHRIEVGLAKGWHNFSLQLLMHGGPEDQTDAGQDVPDAKQTRVRLRGLRYVAFKKPNPSPE
jgi:hypothetical protein